MPRKMLNTTQFARSKGVTPGRIRQLIAEDRIPEAFRVGDSPRSPWVIPENARILYPPERNRSFDKIKEWLHSEDWERTKSDHIVVKEFINDADYWLQNTE